MNSPGSDTSKSPAKSVLLLSGEKPKSAPKSAPNAPPTKKGAREPTADRPTAARVTAEKPEQSFAKKKSKGFVTSQELREQASLWREQAAKESATQRSSTLAVKLGDKLTVLVSERQQTAQEIVKEWDTDGSGCVSKPEFTLACRRLKLVGDPSIPEAMFKHRGLSKEDHAVVEALFDSLDLDGGGDLDPEELETGLHVLLEKAAAARGQQEALQEKLDSYNESAALYDQAAAATEAAEAIEGEIRELVDNPTIQLRAGKQLIKYTKESQLSDLLSSWDTSGDGEVDINEVVAGFKACGIDGTDEELLSLAQGMDADGSGTLEMEELKVAVEELMSSRKASEQIYQEAKARLATALTLAEAEQLAAEKFNVKGKETRSKRKAKAAAPAPGASGSPSGTPMGVRPPV